ncbi:hypothetical protein ASC89_02555 [Devosia sp. Root413D1]|nr:hypothetical protein ASC68_02520 [Devosia sp. Root105]KQW85966.1 hypothetical protein ASC89_02555 [Devosia sp. Root413D1]
MAMRPRRRFQIFCPHVTAGAGLEGGSLLDLVCAGFLGGADGLSESFIGYGRVRPSIHRRV